MRNWLGVFQIVSADAGVLVEATEAVGEHRLSFWDAMIWATARRNGCSALVSEDMQDGRLLSDVETINPFATNAEARLARSLEA